MLNAFIILFRRSGSDGKLSSTGSKYPSTSSIESVPQTTENQYLEMANHAKELLEMKDKFRDGPAVGGTWDEFSVNRKSNIDNYYKTGELWGPNGSTGRTESSPVASSVVTPRPGSTPYTPIKKTYAPLRGKADRDRSGLASRVVNYGSGGSSSGRGSRGSRTKPSSSRIGGRYGL